MITFEEFMKLKEDEIGTGVAISANAVSAGINQKAQKEFVKEFDKSRGKKETPKERINVAVKRVARNDAQLGSDLVNPQDRNPNDNI